MNFISPPRAGTSWATGGSPRQERGGARSQEPAATRAPAPCPGEEEAGRTGEGDPGRPRRQEKVEEEGLLKSECDSLTAPGSPTSHPARLSPASAPPQVRLPCAFLLVPRPPPPPSPEQTGVWRLAEGYCAQKAQQMSNAYALTAPMTTPVTRHLSPRSPELPQIQVLLKAGGGSPLLQ